MGRDTEKIRGDSPGQIGVRTATVDAVNEKSVEHHHKVTDGEVGAGNCRKERVGQSSASLAACSLWIGVDMHLAAVAWHAVKGEGGCDPWAIVVGDSLLNRLAGVGGTV
jgi:hypothetical protein